MAVSLKALYEGQSDGITFSTGNSGANGDSAAALVSPGTSGAITYSTDHPAHGGGGLSHVQATAAQTCYVRYDDTADFTAGAISQYFWLSGSPSATIEWPGRVTSVGDSASWSWQITSGRLLRISAGGTAQMATAPATGGLYRWESQWRNVTSGGSIDMQLFAGDSLTPLDSITVNSVTVANVPRRFRLGRTSTGSALAEWWTDSLQIVTGDDTPLGPPTSPIDSDSDVRWQILNDLWVPIPISQFPRERKIYIPFPRRVRRAQPAGVQFQVTSDVDVQWNVSNLTTSNADLRWRVLAAVSSDSDVRWRLRAVTTSDIDLRWPVRAVVTSDVDARWPVRATAQADVDLRWRVRAQVASDVDARWRVVGAVVTDVDLRWPVRSVAQSDADVRWRVSATVASDVDLRWSVSSSLTLVQSDLDVRWRVRVVTLSDLDLRWPVRLAAVSDVTVPWRVFGVMASDADLRWRTLEAVTSDLGLLWAALGTTDAVLTALWAVQPPVVVSPSAAGIVVRPRQDRRRIVQRPRGGGAG